MTSTSNKLVTVIGGSGFLGRHIVQALAKNGYRIRVAVRRPDLAGFLLPLGMVGQIRTVQGNVRYPASINAACAGADAVVNLTGILYPSGRQNFEGVHVFGAEAVARSAAAAGARTLIHLSSIGADPQSESEYARSKGEGEARVLKAFPRATILRPSVVFGPEDDFFNRFAGMARVMPALPLIGGGLTKFQPVYVGDIAQAVVKLIDHGGNDGMIYELGGPEVMTMKEIMEFVLKAVQRKRLLVPIPFSVAKLQASVLQILPKPMLTMDQVKLLEHDNVVSREAIDEGRTLEGLGIFPQGPEAIVPRYLEQYRRTGSYARTRA